MGDMWHWGSYFFYCAQEMFSRPVDPELDGCPNYLSVIDQPMDLGTIRSRAKAKFYRVSSLNTGIRVIGMAVH